MESNKPKPPSRDGSDREPGLDEQEEQSAVDLPDREVMTILGGPRMPPLPVEPPIIYEPMAPLEPDV